MEETGPGGEHVGPLLDAYRTDELDADARAAVAAHLEACAPCREELAALGPWMEAIGRGYAALREAARQREPDWAAQRAAVVARTSGRRSRARQGWSFRRWAPQVALVAVAALIVGVVWRERAREPGREPVATTSTPAPGASAGGAAGSGERAPRQAAPDTRREAAPEEGRDALADAAPPAAPPAAAQAAREEQARAREDEAPVGELPDADEPVMAEGLPLEKAAKEEGARFARDARAALGASDTAAARRALVLWSDTLAPGEAERHTALADSLRELLAPE